MGFELLDWGSGPTPVYPQGVLMGLPPSSLEVGAVRGYPLLSHGFGSVGPGRAPGADSEVSLRVLEAQEIVPILVS